MTEQIKSALHTLNKWKNCNYIVDADDCIDRICVNCEFNYDHYDIEGSLDVAIRSLKAWEEVLQELRECEIAYKNNEFKPLTDNAYYWQTRRFGIKDAINIINKKLAEIEE